MNKEKGVKEKYVKIIIILFSIVFLLNFINFVILPDKVSTGKGTSTVASVIFSLISDPTITIFEPENVTYNFTSPPYTLNLSVVADMPVQTWNFSLYSQRNNQYVYQDVAFPPNITFNAVRYGNRMEVTATTSTGGRDSANVSFFVFVPNVAPYITGIVDPIYVCEDDQLVYFFNAIDEDEDFITGSISNSSGYFFVFRLGQNLNITNFVLASASLQKVAAGGINAGSFIHHTYISVSDGNLSDTIQTNITVIEINNPPILQNIGTRTIWNRGEDSTLYENADVTDTEFDFYGYGSLNYNFSITNSSKQQVNLFNVTFGPSSEYTINFTADTSTSLGNYTVRVCVNDTGILNPHPQINSRCGQSGGIQTTCDSFQLTITDQNRAPTITAYYPTNLSFNATSISNLYFNITKHDPDGTIPDAYWYVNNGLRQYNEGQNASDEFRFTFGCGVSGNHTIKAEITDGLLNDSVQWNVSVSLVSCPSLPPAIPGAGGGGGAGLICRPLLGCGSWDVCQNAEKSLEEGILSGVQYREIQQNCTLRGLEEERCGFQTRYCSDLNSCLPAPLGPNEYQACLYLENPSCSDGYQNCHDGECELFVDCGGPCNPCPTCSDGERNQGEEGIDCGGPCPWKCIPETPLLKRKEVIYGILIILLIVIVLIIIKLIRILRYKRAMDERRKKTNI